MSIKNATKSDIGYVINDGTEFVPFDDTARCAEIEAWAASGGVVAVEPQEFTARRIRAERDTRIAVVQWRYERHAREVRLGLTPTDSEAVLHELDLYVQALADLPTQEGFPLDVTFPVLGV